MPVTLAGGRVTLDPARSIRAMETLGAQLGLSGRAAAEGVLTVADATMARAARRVALSRGLDPRRLPLIAFGGAGPLHGARLVSALPCAEVWVPRFPGNLSAWGMAHADPERDRVRSVLIRDPDRRREDIERVGERLRAEAEAELRDEGLLFGPSARSGTAGKGGPRGRGPRERGPRGREARRSSRKGATPKLVAETTVDCRYVGQSYTLPVPLVPSRARAAIRRGFDQAHAAQFGHGFPDREIEAVNVRVRLCVRSRVAMPGRAKPARSREVPPAAKTGEQKVWFDGRTVKTPCFERDLVPAGSVIEGPAIVMELGSTCVIEPGHQARVDRAGNLRIRRG